MLKTSVKAGDLDAGTPEKKLMKSVIAAGISEYSSPVSYI